MAGMVAPFVQHVVFHWSGVLQRESAALSFAAPLTASLLVLPDSAELLACGGSTTSILCRLVDCRSCVVSLLYLNLLKPVPAVGVSGVIAVCTYGLYGCATTRWGMSPAAAASGVFDSFWDTIGFITNGLVFFYAGVATTNFFVRSTQVRGPAGRVATVSFSKKLQTPLLWVPVCNILLCALCKSCCSAQAASLELRQTKPCHWPSS